MLSYRGWGILISFWSVLVFSSAFFRRFSSVEPFAWVLCVSRSIFSVISQKNWRHFAVALRCCPTRVSTSFPGSTPLLRWRLRAEKTLAHTVRPPAKYFTNRGVYCHVIHNKISSLLPLISGSRNRKWLKMSEDLAPFCVFKLQNRFFVDR